MPEVSPSPLPLFLLRIRIDQGFLFGSFAVGSVWEAWVSLVYVSGSTPGRQLEVTPSL